LFDAVLDGITQLRQQHGDRHLVVIGDGADSTSGASRSDLAEALDGDPRVRVSAVALGPYLGLLDDRHSTTGRRLLAGITRRSGGLLLEAFDGSDLGRAVEAAIGEVVRRSAWRLDLVAPEPGLLEVVGAGAAPAAIGGTVHFVLDCSLSMNARTLAALQGDRADSPAPRIAVLLSDGEETCGGDPADAAGNLSQGELSAVHVVAFDLDESTGAQLARVAELGGGQLFAVRDAEELVGTLRAAVATPFRLESPSGRQVAAGTVGQGGIVAPAGRWVLRIDGLEPAQVEIVPGQLVRVEVGR
jgi:hypothetical protein